MKIATVFKDIAVNTDDDPRNGFRGRKKKRRNPKTEGVAEKRAFKIGEVGRLHQDS
jgi:hypothetical protein